ncbi:MAG: hypothetical protein IKU65_06900 [Oscillospiraceae bacterium]|nr:hypothetical protein [Oscillospiraceae bacterium]
MTERLYEKDSYCREFEATVVSCEKNGDLYDVVLDRTAFFPEGGGQYADKGTVDGIAVEDVQIHNGIVVHKMPCALECGRKVTGRIDWEIRFCRMQRHSGEHILSGVVHSLFGYNNVGFHMSEREMTVDFDGVFSPGDIENVEKAVNSVVWKNLKITISYPTDDEEKTVSYRSKLENIENLRLVTIEDTDCCACCAPHVSRTGEIGIVKVIDSTPNKGGTRLTVLAGATALHDYSELNRANKQMMKTLSVPREDVSAAAERQVELVSSLRYENQELAKRLAWSELSVIKINSSAISFAENLSYEELRHCSNMLMEQGCEVCLLFSTNDRENYIYVVSGVRDIRAIVKSLNDTFDGKGGGKPNYAQGKIVSGSTETIRTFAEEILK